MKNFKRNTLALFIFVFLIVLTIVVYTLYNQSLTINDSSAATNAVLVLNLTSPTSVANVPNGTLITLSLKGQNTTGVSAGEIVLKFDPAVLNATAINELPTTNPISLGINKTMNNTTGRITIDIAKIGAGDYPNDTYLVDFVFQVKNSAVASTIVNVAPETTFGIPNQLSTTGYGLAKLVFNPAICGDSIVQKPNDSGVTEVCDSGSQNGIVCTPSYGGTCQYCNSTCTALVTVQGPKCGDNIVNGSEQCDKGSLNGIVCTPAYGGSCTYCTNSCTNVTVQGPKCGDGVIQSPEACDDGNLVNGDQCSSTCSNKCIFPQVWNGLMCRDPLAIGCKGDYNLNGTVDISDFSDFARNYKQTPIDCKYNITGSTCYLDIQDFGEFASVYKVVNACLL